jgi:diaminohydroxyphosphoribosylaminopyrimidine deaminase/5-amino-6-(5-phosphoribosylamino)uracil reductase
MHMRMALSLARKGWGRTSPNPMVGAVVARGTRVLGSGYHASYGALHAEPVALNEAGARAKGATLYVSLEPCTHHGRTPPCVDAIIASGVRRVVIATRDPNPVAAGGVERLRGAGLEVVVGVEEEAARELNAAFFHAIVSDRPWVTLKLAVSVDGAIADAKRSRGWLTGMPARRVVHVLRAGHDAVAVGLGSVLADDPLLTVRDLPPPRIPPTRVVFDREARLPLTSRLVATVSFAPVIVVARWKNARTSALVARGVQLIEARDMGEALVALRESGLRSLLVEGGAGVAGALLEHDLVDRLIIFRAPVVLGAGALGAFSRAPGWSLERAPHLRVIKRRVVGDDEMTIYAMR